MSKYDFSTLNPTDFEKLVCDLLNASAAGNSSAKYRTSKEGKDKGIDILFSTAQNDFEVVVQVKHYVKSTFSKLKSDLIHKEAAKVKELAPQAYIFVTSLELSVENRKEIMSIFSPYIRSLEDVMGKDDLNNLLAIHTNIEDRHYKLWFSSTIALQKLLNYKFIGRNDEFSEEGIKRKLRLFVSTQELENARWVLENNKFLIITGEPGVGKTTLSEILIYKYLSKDFELTYIYDDIKDIELTLKNDNSKQIFYFDDFLGHTQAEINKSKAAEIFLLKIISRIEKAENKYLILNTRKFILTTFLEESERFKNFNPLRAENKIEIGIYSYGARRRMLDNHIFECEHDDLKIHVLKKLSFFICSHQNFSPRHISFFTSKVHSGDLHGDKFKEFVTENLINPKRIWEHAYCNQISIYENLFLNTLYSLNGSSSTLSLEKAYNARLHYEAKHNNFVKPLNSFKNCLQNLNGGFVSVNNIRDYTEISFINPSLEDFLRFWIEENTLEVERILFAAVALDQWYYFFVPFFYSEYVASDAVMEFFATYYEQILRPESINEDLYRSAMLLFYFDDHKYSGLCVKLLKDIKDWDFLHPDSYITAYSNKFLQAAKSTEIINQTISNFKLNFFVNTLFSVNHLDELVEVVTLFVQHYGFNFRFTFQDREDDFKFDYKVRKLKKLCQKLVKKEIEKQYSYLLTNRTPDEHLDVLDRLKELKKIIRTYMFPEFKANISIITQMDWNTLIERNVADEIVLGIKSTDYDYYPEQQGFDEYEEYDEYYDYEKEKSGQIGIPVDFNDVFLDDLPF